MIAAYLLLGALDELARCLYCPALYRATRQLIRPCVCPVCIQDPEKARGFGR